MTRSTEQVVRSALADSLRVKAALDPAAIGAAAELVRDAVLAGHKILICGNGGSAADAQHIASELVGRFVAERRPLAAIALTTDTSALTSIANDYGYEHVFSRQIDALGAQGDVLIAITTSGTSKNVLAAIEAARGRGMKVVGLTGARGGEMIARCDAGIAVPSTVTARIQESHIAIGHILCEVVDEAFVPAPAELGNGHAPAKQMMLEQLVAWREAQRARKRTVVWTNGVFDVFHAGHLEALRGARAHGDVLVVGVNDDASTRANKGADRPVFPCAERVALIAALELVDAVLVFGDATPERVLAALKPDVHVKGADYADKPIPERAIVESYGGRVELLPLVPGRSTTDTIARLRK